MAHVIMSSAPAEVARRMESEAAERLKSDASAMVSHGDYVNARAKYTECLAAFRGMLYPREGDFGYLDHLKKIAIVLANRALMCLRLEEFEAALLDAQEALDLSPSYSKAAHRIGVASTELSKHRPSCATSLEVWETFLGTREALKLSTGPLWLIGAHMEHVEIRRRGNAYLALARKLEAREQGQKKKSGGSKKKNWPRDDKCFTDLTDGVDPYSWVAANTTNTNGAVIDTKHCLAQMRGLTETLSTTRAAEVAETACVVQYAGRLINKAEELQNEGHFEHACASMLRASVAEREFAGYVRQMIGGANAQEGTEMVEDMELRAAERILDAGGMAWENGQSSLALRCWEVGLVGDPQGAFHSNCAMAHRDAGNLAKARELYETAAELHNGDACAELGFLYVHGRGVEPDFAKAKVLFARAKAASISPAVPYRLNQICQCELYMGVAAMQISDAQARSAR